MPIGKEFTIRQEDKPGTLGKCARLLPIRTSTSSRFNRSLLRKARVRFISFWTITQRPKRFSINTA
jgi:hypothetical protein